MKKIYALLSATLVLVSMTDAKTYTLGSGKWNDAAVWNGDYAGTTVKAGDEVIITGQITITTPIVVEGTLRVEKGAGMVGMKDLTVSATGKFINNGNTVMKRIINEGTIQNNLLMEAMTNIENKGTLTNNNNMVAGNDLHHYSGTATGNGGAYFVNNNIAASPSATFGSNIKVFYGNDIEQPATTAAATSMNLFTQIKNNNVVLNVTNPQQEDVAFFTIEKSKDGKNFTLVEMINKNTGSDEVAMHFTDWKADSGYTYYRVKAINSTGDETALPIATVQLPEESMFSMAR